MKLLHVALLLAPCAAHSLAQDAASDYTAKAGEFLQAGDLKGAEAELRKALERSPTDTTVLTSLGGVLGMQGQVQQANSYLSKAVTLEPQNPLLRRNLAANEWQLGQFEAARTNLDQILRSDPSDKVATFLLGMVSENERNYTRGIQLLESVPEVAERHPELFVALASCYYHTQRRPNAQSSLRELLTHTANLQVMLMAERVAMDAHDYPVALQIAERAISRYPASSESYLNKASAEIKLNYFSQSLKSARMAAHLHPSAQTKRELAFAEWRAGDKKSAISGFEEIVREFPSDVETFETYGALLLEDGSPGSKARAVQLLKTALRLDSSSFEAHYQMGKLELDDGEVEMARKDLTQAIQANPNDSRGHFALSRLYRRLHLDSEADRELEQFRKAKAADN